MARDISRGINISQSLIAMAEGYLLHGNFKDALLFGGAVAISNLASSNGMIATNATTEKYVVEPAIASVLVAAGASYMGKKNVMKRAVEGFLVGGSSAGLNMYALNFTLYGNKTPNVNSYAAARSQAVAENRGLQSTVIA